MDSVFCACILPYSERVDFLLTKPTRLRRMPCHSITRDAVVVIPESQRAWFCAGVSSKECYLRSAFGGVFGCVTI